MTQKHISLLTYETWLATGSKPWLVLLPGVNCGAWFFNNGYNELRSNFNVLLVNNPGVGGSGTSGIKTIRDVARQVVKILEQEGIGACHVLGHSMGGFVAQEVALLVPNKVQRLVLVSTSMGQPDTSRDMLTLAKVTGKTWEQFNRDVAKAPETALQMLFGRSFLSERSDDYATFIHERKVHHPKKQASALHLALGGTFSSVGRANNIAVPTMVIHGDVDPLVTARSGQRLAENLQQAYWWELLDVGHFPSLEHPGLWHGVTRFLLGEQVGVPVEHTPHFTKTMQQARMFWHNLFKYEPWEVWQWR